MASSECINKEKVVDLDLRRRLTTNSCNEKVQLDLKDTVNSYKKNKGRLNLFLKGFEESKKINKCQEDYEAKIAKRKYEEEMNESGNILKTKDYFAIVIYDFYTRSQICGFVLGNQMKEIMKIVGHRRGKEILKIFMNYIKTKQIIEYDLNPKKEHNKCADVLCILGSGLIKAHSMRVDAAYKDIYFTSKLSKVIKDFEIYYRKECNTFQVLK